MERGDFAGGTSSRSTKLVHGGVRYLEQAVRRIDRSQFRLVREALRERAALLELAPHLVHELAIFVPLYQLRQQPYYRIGLNLYDRLAGRYALRRSEFVPREQAHERFPYLREEVRGQGPPRQLRGGVVYYDGQFDDARMNLALALTAARHGAALANYVAVVGLVKDGSGRLSGAIVRDRLGGAEWEVRARVVLNAAGPYVDELRRLDDPGDTPLLRVSAGSHLVLGERFPRPRHRVPHSPYRGWPGDLRAALARTAPGRHHGGGRAGDRGAAAGAAGGELPAGPPAQLPEPAGGARRRDGGMVGAAPADRRPAAAGGRRRRQRRDTAALTRDHYLSTSRSGLITVAGGKWTTYRVMAVHAVNRAVEAGGLAPRRTSQTRTTPLLGAAGYRPDAAGLQRRYHLAADVAAHLDRAFGDRAHVVAQLAGAGYGSRLAPRHPYLEAEVVYAARHEAACTVDDVLARRTRLAFVDSVASLASVPRVAELLAAELGWSAGERRRHADAARARLETAQAIIAGVGRQ